MEELNPRRSLFLWRGQVKKSIEDMGAQSIVGNGVSRINLLNSKADYDALSPADDELYIWKLPLPGMAVGALLL